jgi:rifampin ADP-ribosylating transferase
MPSTDSGISRPFYHGTRADLKPGDLIAVGYQSNFGTGKPLSWVYFTGTLDAAIWGAELAAGSGRGRIYLVEPTGPFVDDPNLTDKKFPGNPTQSYRSREPLQVIGEVTEWEGHSPERLQQMKDNVARLRAEGAEIID